MKLSFNWIKSFINEPIDINNTLEKLTMAGIELESIEEINFTEECQEPDQIVEFKITPNRGDCLSAQGIARDIVALSNYTFKNERYYVITPQVADTPTIHVIANNDCPNYCGLIIKDVDNNQTTPNYIIDRLKKNGIRQISPIVDIANYVMIELGQPLHAFDMDKTGDSLTVRFANSNEEITTLDNSKIILNNDTLIIADSNNKIAAIAGIMGSLDSGVTEQTKNIIIESAFFTPNTIIGKAKRHGLSSDASYRFERGVDPELQSKAIIRVANLIQKHCGGKIGQINHQINSSYIHNKKIAINYDYINKISGYNFTKQDINQILEKLQFTIELQNDNAIITPPSYRFDIKIKEDIVEEIVRVFGYDNIPTTMPNLPYSITKPDTKQEHINNLKNKMCIMGFNEIISYAFIENSTEQKLGNRDINTPVKLQNSIANWDVMRTSLIADLIKAFKNNYKHGHKSIKLFEIANVFYAESPEQQPLKLAGLIAGEHNKSCWINSKRDVDFYDLKKVVENILINSSDEISFKACNTNSVFHGGRCAEIYKNETKIGIIGQLNPALNKDFDLDFAPYIFELDVFTIIDSNYVKIRTLNKLPKLTRDLAFIFDENIYVADVIKAIKTLNLENLLDIQVFDVYSGGNLPANKKSIGLKFTLQGLHKTMTEDEINSVISKAQKTIEENFMAILR